MYPDDHLLEKCDHVGIVALIVGTPVTALLAVDGHGASYLPAYMVGGGLVAAAFLRPVPRTAAFVALGAIFAVLYTFLVNVNLTLQIVLYCSGECASCLRLSSVAALLNDDLYAGWMQHGVLCLRTNAAATSCGALPIARATLFLWRGCAHCTLTPLIVHDAFKIPTRNCEHIRNGYLLHPYRSTIQTRRQPPSLVYLAHRCRCVDHPMYATCLDTTQREHAPICSLPQALLCSSATAGTGAGRG